MARLEYFIVAESISVDQHTNRVSLFNVVEQLTAPEFPVIIPQLVAVTAWNAEAGDDQTDFQIRVRMIHPDGSTKDFTHNFRIPADRCRTIMTLQGVRVAQAGKLVLDLNLNDQHIASHTIDVRQADSDVAAD